MNASKIVLPKEVAEAIEYYTRVCDCKTDALMDIHRMGFEGTRSELILRYFDGNYDELMEALICGYEVEKTPEEKVREFYTEDTSEIHYEEQLRRWTIRRTLDLLGIKIAGVNADE